MRTCALVLSLTTVLAGCDGDSTPDAGTMDSGTMDSGTPSDAGPSDAGPSDSGASDSGASDSGASDSGPIRDDAGASDSGVTDAGAGEIDGGGADAGTDAGATRTDPGPVQCRMNSDCAGLAAECNRSAPGGICLGCGAAGSGTCPTGTICSVFGSCVRECGGDADCNVGFRCTGRGMCAVRTCSSNAECGPYRCSGPGGHCERFTCSAGRTCPAGFTCTADLCIEL